MVFNGPQHLKDEIVEKMLNNNKSLSQHSVLDIYTNGVMHTSSKNHFGIISYEYSSRILKELVDAGELIQIKDNDGAFIYYSHPLWMI